MLFVNPEKAHLLVEGEVMLEANSVAVVFVLAPEVMLFVNPDETPLTSESSAVFTEEMPFIVTFAVLVELDPLLLCLSSQVISVVS